jgi:dethiobiotin synthetase
MLRGIFVTGTDTNVGKTVLCAALLHRFRADAPLRYWKPMQTGIEQDDDTGMVKRLSSASDSEIYPDGIRLRGAVSPHLAARWNNQVIRIADVRKLLPHCESSSKMCWVIEGAGGLLVPLNNEELMVDLIGSLGLPAVIATRSSLGTINHTLLTVEALRQRSLPIAGVVMIGEPNPDNRAAIEHHGKVPVLGEMPRFDRLDSVSLAQWASHELDPESHLLKFFA